MSIFTAKLAKSWNVSANLRNAYVSLPDMMGWLFYQNKVAMLAAGWTIKWTCDGTTGPSGAGDTTDRWTSKTPAGAVRGAAAGNPQSYAVLQNADGVQVLLAFQGASDDIGRISYSPTGVFTLAAPTTNQPTAADEMVVSALTSLVNAGTVGDRVMTIWCSADTKHWSHFIARAGSTIHLIGVERINSLCGTGVFAVPYVGYRQVNFNRGNNPNPATTNPVGAIASSPAVGAANWQGTLARVFTAGAFRTVRVGAGFLNFTHLADGFTRTFNNSNDPLNSTTPGFQNGRTPLTPLYWTGEKVTNLDGFLGSPVDWWLSHSADNLNVPGFGNFFPGYEPGDSTSDPERTNWLVALGSSVVRPWKNSASVMRAF